jgi:hypothetical protein
VRSSRNKNNLLKSFFLACLIFFSFALILKMPILINGAVDKVQKVDNYKELGKNLLGFGGKKNILLLFMNNAEQRYGGGFIGSVGVVAVENGKIKAEPVKSVYYFDRYLEAKDPYVNPTDFELEEEADTIRNSGQNIDWQENGKRAKLIYESKTGNKIDFVIGITPEVLKSLLEETGPITLIDYDKKITAENIIDVLQTEVEFGKDKIDGKDPKSILSVLATNLIEKLSTKSSLELSEISQKLKEEADKRQIVLYSADFDVAKIIKSLRYDGSIVTSSQDFLQISEKNLSIDKSNAYIDRSLDRRMKIDKNGVAVVELNIKRKQNREKSIPYIDPRDNNFTYLIKENISNIRVVIPKNSVILQKDGLSEFKKITSNEFVDIYEFNSQLIPLIESSYKLTYKLPFNFSAVGPINVDSFIQMQNGGWLYNFTNTLEVPSDWDLLASNKRELSIKSNEVMYSKIVDKDIFLSFIYEKK